MKLRLARPNRPFVISRFYCATIIFRLKAFHSFFSLVFFVFNHKSRASRVWNNNCYHDYNQMYFYRIKYTGNIHLSCMFILCLQSRKCNACFCLPSECHLSRGWQFHACCYILLKPTAEENDMEKQGTYITDISRLNNFLYLCFALEISPYICFERSRIDLKLDRYARFPAVGYAGCQLSPNKAFRS